MPTSSDPHLPDNIQVLPELLRGRTFVVGDLHGCYDVFMRALDRGRFAPDEDRVIAVGDLIDRGPASAQSVQLLREPWFYAVRGNHEDMLLRAQTDGRWAVNAIRNGGEWWLETPDSLRADILKEVKRLPIVIETQTRRGSVGFLHAEVPVGLTWDDFKGSVLHGDESAIEAALRGRARFKSGNMDGVPGAGRIFVGHTIQGGASRLGNIYYIDTGAFAYEVDRGFLTMANVLCETRSLTNDERPRCGVRRISGEDTSGRSFSSYVKV